LVAPIPADIPAQTGVHDPWLRIHGLLARPFSKPRSRNEWLDSDVVSPIYITRVWRSDTSTPSVPSRVSLIDSKAKKPDRSGIAKIVNIDKINVKFNF
jgi:hypothetical protein